MACLNGLRSSTKSLKSEAGNVQDLLYDLTSSAFLVLQDFLN